MRFVNISIALVSVCLLLSCLNIFDPTSTTVSTRERTAAVFEDRTHYFDEDSPPKITIATANANVNSTDVSSSSSINNINNNNIIINNNNKGRSENVTTNQEGSGAAEEKNEIVPADTATGIINTAAPINRNVYVSTGTYHYPNSASKISGPGGLKIMIFITTHMSNQHAWFLKSCWPPAMQKSLLLNSTDVVVYLNVVRQKRTEAMTLLQNTFQDRNLTIHVRQKLGKQGGAMAALQHAMKEKWFAGYDWLVRVNPDVIIRNDASILDTMVKDDKATGVFINCRRSNYRKPKIHTDFFALKPSALPSDIFLSRRGNSEMSFTMDIQESILNKKGQRFLDDSAPIGVQCRAASTYELTTTPSVTHFHRDEKQMSNMTCPIIF
jgi:hypothetical protein